MTVQTYTRIPDTDVTDIESDISAIQAGQLPPAVDAFSRMRVSDPVTLFDNQQSYGDNALVWENSATGTGAVSNVTGASAVRLTTGGTGSGAQLVRQTRVYHRYQPGKSQMVLMTFVLGAAKANVRKRVGYFDASNGVFLEQTSASLRFVQRSNVSGTPSDAVYADQADWNLDTLDGTGPSGITLDLSKAQILVIDLQWLGVGRVRCGFDLDGVVVYAHEFLNANARTAVYMTTACLPCRFEITNTDTAESATTLDHICCAVISEGGFEDSRGFEWSTNGGAAGVAVTTRRPLVSIRAATTGPNSVRNTGHVIPRNIDVMASNNGCLVEVVLNGTLTGASFTAVDSLSIAQKDTAASAISGGYVVASFFVPASAGTARGTASSKFFRDFPLVYTGLGNVQDTITVVATSVTGTSTVNAAIDWQEIY